jgi:cytidylate kinase
MASESSGLHEDFIASCDERAVSNFAFSVSSNYYFTGSGAHQVQSKAYFSQFEAIKKLAEEESFVIVGRVADYVLRHKENKISIFICADVSDRVARVMEYENISDKKAEKLIAKADKNRAKYYNFFSHNKWGDAKTYDICINSSVLGIDKTADYLIDYIENVLRAKGLK